MSFFNFFRNLFGGGDHQQPPNYKFGDDWQDGDNFRDPIWQNGDDDDDDDFRHSRPGIHFKIFSDPFEMTRYFEFQMDNMLKNFLFGFGHNGNILPADKDSFGALPPIQSNPRANLRDEVLKSDIENIPSNYFTPDTKLDTDLDGKISMDDLSKVWKDPNTSQSIEPYNPPQRYNFHTFGKFTSTKIIRQPDGSVEQHRTIRDSEGNEETTVTRKIGDKTHTIITKKDKNGVEIKTEDLINMNENELQDFEKKWKPITESKYDEKSLTYFPWHKFFKPNPKL